MDNAIAHILLALRLNKNTLILCGSRSLSIIQRWLSRYCCHTEFFLPDLRRFISALLNAQPARQKLYVDASPELNPGPSRFLAAQTILPSPWLIKSKWCCVGKGNNRGEMKLLWVKVAYWSFNPEYYYQVCLSDNRQVQLWSDPSWSIVYICCVNRIRMEQVVVSVGQCSSIFGTFVVCLKLHNNIQIRSRRHRSRSFTFRDISYFLIRTQLTTWTLQQKRVVQHRVGILTSCDVQTLRISDVWTTWAQLYRQ